MNPLQILQQGIKSVPATKYALGVAGVAAAVAIVAGFKLDYRVAVFGTIIMVGMMFILLLFAVLSTLGPTAVKIPALVLAWVFVILTSTSGGLLMISYFFSWPRALESYLNTPPKGVDTTLVNTEFKGTTSTSNFENKGSSVETDYNSIYQTIRTNELDLSRWGESAFKAHQYNWSIRFLEQAKTVESSGVWQSSYPYLIGSYFIKGDISKARDGINDMIFRIKRYSGYLNSKTTLGFLLNALGIVRASLSPSYQKEIDSTIDNVIQLRINVPD